MGFVAGVCFGLIAAVTYTLANIALRQSVKVDPFLVAAVKAVPTVVFLTPFVIWMRLAGQRIATNLKMLPRFAVVALIGQFVGNAAFQVALGSIGLAATVPITLGVMIIGGAVLGRWMLGEPVRLRTVAAMITLILAVVILSQPGTGEATRGATSELPSWVGALCAAASGGAYALFGTVMRRTLNGGLSAPATMLISGVVGTVSLWGVTLIRVSAESIMTIPLDAWAVMSLAGVFNFVAFVALAVALKALPVVAVNLINASQVAMAAVAGVVLFSEPVTLPLIAGITLTFAGLAILASRRRRPSRDIRTSVAQPERYLH